MGRVCFDVYNALILIAESCCRRIKYQVHLGNGGSGDKSHRADGLIGPESADGINRAAQVDKDDPIGCPFL